MKKAIELLERAREALEKEPRDLSCAVQTRTARCIIGEVLDELKAPRRWYTPEQWKERTGEEWPDMNAVYVQAYKDYQGTGDWEPQYEWGVALHCEVKGLRFTIICATGAGKPPDGWVPEGA
jgi:hypothetical protein